MIERWSDRSTGFNIPSMGQREQATWTNFTMHLGILDTFHMDASRQIGTKRFTWKNQNRTPNWSRIDRFYTSYELHEQEEIHGIWPQIAYISDHSAAFLSVHFAGKKRPQKAHFDRRHDAKAKEKFTKACKDAMNNTDLKTPGEWIAMALQQIRRVSITLKKERKRQGRTLYTSQFLAIEEVERRLKRDCTDLEA